MPARIQRRRTRGWRAPAGARYVGRGTRYGNPFVIGTDADDAAHATALYRAWLENNAYEVHAPDISPKQRQKMDDDRDWIIKHAAEVAGRDLMCWCPTSVPGKTDHCHARVLIDLANDHLLRDQFGPKLTDSLTAPQQDTAVDAYVLIQAVEGPHTARAWMIGMNPHLDDQAPLLAIQDGRGRDVLVAARAYLGGVYA